MVVCQRITSFKSIMVGAAASVCVCVCVYAACTRVTTGCVVVYNSFARDCFYNPAPMSSLPLLSRHHRHTFCSHSVPASAIPVPVPFLQVMFYIEYIFNINEIGKILQYLFN